MSNKTTQTYKLLINNAVTTQTLSNHLDYLGPIMSSLGLMAYYNEYLAYTGASHQYSGLPDAPYVYHGKTHTEQVVLAAYEGSLYSNLTLNEARILIVAALFHDIKHSYGRETDSHNVRKAIGIANLIHGGIKAKGKLSDSDFAQACSLIRHTQYPYPIKNKVDIGLSAKILRDADRMVCVYTQDVELRLNLILGLANETANSNITDLKTFLNNQKNFMITIAWETRWASMKAIKLNWPSYCRSLITQLDTKLRFNPIKNQFYITD